MEYVCGVHPMTPWWAPLKLKETLVTWLMFMARQLGDRHKLVHANVDETGRVNWSALCMYTFEWEACAHEGPRRLSVLKYNGSSTSTKVRVVVYDNHEMAKPWSDRLASWSDPEEPEMEESIFKSVYASDPVKMALRNEAMEQKAKELGDAQKERTKRKSVGQDTVCTSSKMLKVAKMQAAKSAKTPPEKQKVKLLMD